MEGKNKREKELSISNLLKEKKEKEKKTCPKQADMILSCPTNFLQKVLLSEERKLETQNG